MKKYFLLIGLISALVFSALSNAESKDVVGWVEKVCICPGNVLVHAKLDTGAKTSSINAPNLEVFRRGSDQWVRFDLTNQEGKTVTFEQKVMRIARIKRKGAKSQDRLVIRLGICVGNIYKEVEVNLVDRSHYKYQMLIGRNFLRGCLLIDSALKYTVEPKCREVQ